MDKLVFSLVLTLYGADAHAGSGTIEQGYGLRQREWGA